MALSIVRSIPTHVGFTARLRLWWTMWSVHPHVRGVYACTAAPSSITPGPSPRMWGLRTPLFRLGRQQRSIPTCVGFMDSGSDIIEPGAGPSPRAWGLLHLKTMSRPRRTVHPHVRGVYTEIKSKISRVSIKTALLPAEKFKILFLVKIKGSAAAFLDHTIFRDQSPPGLHFEIALHL